MEKNQVAEKIKLTQAEKERFADWLDQESERDIKTAQEIEKLIDEETMDFDPESIYMRVFRETAKYKGLLANQIRGKKGE